MTAVCTSEKKQAEKNRRYLYAHPRFENIKRKWKEQMACIRLYMYMGAAMTSAF